MVAQPELLPPRYQRVQRLAGGGMGEVYRAADAKLGRTVAIKVLSERFAVDADARRRLIREARAAARLSGEPHTVTIYDVGKWLDRPFIVMEFLAGGSLEEQLRLGGAQPLERVLRWLDQAAGALDHAHAHGVVHRDVKPANLLLDEHGDLHVADFGIATAAGLESLTLTGTVLGTAGYLSPEQAQGRPATAASDRYALGVVAYELLTGERPFARDSLAAEAAAHVNERVPAATSRNGTIPPRLDAALERALAKDPDVRFASCRDFVAALRRGDPAGTVTRPFTAATATLSIPRRSRRRAGVAAALLLLVGAGSGAAVLLVGRGRHAAAPPIVRTVTATLPARTVTDVATTTAGATGPAAETDPLAQGEALLAAGNAEGALPLLQQAVQQLDGSGSADEARADGDLAQALVQLGSCDGVVSLVDRAEQIEGPQPPLDQLAASCSGPPGHGPGHGKKHGDGGDGNGG